MQLQSSGQLWAEGQCLTKPGRGPRTRPAGLAVLLSLPWLLPEASWPSNRIYAPRNFPQLAPLSRAASPRERRCWLPLWPCLDNLHTLGRGRTAVLETLQAPRTLTGLEFSFLAAKVEHKTPLTSHLLFQPHWTTCCSLTSQAFHGFELAVALPGMSFSI